jgi:hypothetical protein
MSSLVVQMTTDQLKALFMEAIRDALGGKNLDIPSSSAPTKGKRAKKVKDPNAPKKEPNDWIKFTSRVRSVLATEMADGKKVLPKAVTQVASALKEASLMPSATDAQIKAAYADWVANPPAVSKMEAEGKSKKSKKSEASDASSTASEVSAANPSSAAAATSEAAPAEKKRGRKPMSEEAKKAAAEKRAATKAAKKGNAAPSVTSAPPAATEDAADSTMDFEPFTWKKMSLLKNARGDCLTEDMEWFGKWDEASKKVDTSAPQPADLDL